MVCELYDDVVPQEPPFDLEKYVDNLLDKIVAHALVCQDGDMLLDTADIILREPMPLKPANYRVAVSIKAMMMTSLSFMTSDSKVLLESASEQAVLLYDRIEQEKKQKQGDRTNGP